MSCNFYLTRAEIVCVGVGGHIRNLDRSLLVKYGLNIPKLGDISSNLVIGQFVLDFSLLTNVYFIIKIKTASFKKGEYKVKCECDEGFL